MVTPCTGIPSDSIYAALRDVDSEHFINMSELTLLPEPDTQLKIAGRLVGSGEMTVDEAVAAFGTLE